MVTAYFTDPDTIKQWITVMEIPDSTYEYYSTTAIIAFSLKYDKRDNRTWVFLMENEFTLWTGYVEDKVTHYVDIPDLPMSVMYGFNKILTKHNEEKGNGKDN